MLADGASLEQPAGSVELALGVGEAAARGALRGAGLPDLFVPGSGSQLGEPRPARGQLRGGRRPAGRQLGLVEAGQLIPAGHGIALAYRDVVDATGDLEPQIRLHRLDGAEGRHQLLTPLCGVTHSVVACSSCR